MLQCSNINKYRDGLHSAGLCLPGERGADPPFMNKTADTHQDVHKVCKKRVDSYLIKFYQNCVANTATGLTYF